MRCNVRENEVLCNVLTLGSMVNTNVTLTKFSAISGAGQAENMHSVSRCSQQKSLGDVTETQEFTKHSPSAHFDSNKERRLIRNFLSGGATTLKLLLQHHLLYHALKIRWKMVVSPDNKTLVNQFLADDNVTCMMLWDEMS